MLGELQTGLLEEAFPADALGPVTNALVLAGVSGVGFHDLADNLGQRGPAGRLIGDEGHDDLGELGIADAVRHLAASHDDQAVTSLVGQGQGRTHGVAVAAEHAALVLDGNGVDRLGFALFGDDFLLGRTDGAYGAGGNGQRDFAQVVQPLVVDDRGLAVVAQDGDVGAVNGAAHVQTAGHGDADLSRHAHLAELFEQFVKDDLDGAGGVRGRGVAVDPTLGVDDVGDAGAGAADGELEAAALELQTVQIFFELLGFVQGADHELNVVAGGEAQVAAGELVGDGADFTDVADGHQTGAAATDGVDFVAALGLVHQDAGLADFMPQPLSLVLGDNRRKEIGKMARANIRDPVFHGFFGIVSGRNESHCGPPSYL